MRKYQLIANRKFPFINAALSLIIYFYISYIKFEFSPTSPYKKLQKVGIKKKIFFSN